MEWIVLLFYMLRMRSVRNAMSGCECESGKNLIDQNDSWISIQHREEKDSCTENLIASDCNFSYEKSEKKKAIGEDMPKAWQACADECGEADF